MAEILKTEAREDNPLGACTESEGVAPVLPPTFNLAAYVNKSELLQQMVKLGVSLHHWERMNDVSAMMLTKDFHRDIKPTIQFLVDNGVDPDALGKVFTKNPFIFNTSLEDLKIRNNYLEYKKFDKEMISKIYTRNPFWLAFSTQRIDTRLGLFQKIFQLSGNEIRQVAVREPRLITSKMRNVQLMNFGFREEMGFEEDQVKSLLVSKPKLWLMQKQSLVNRFDYLHNVIEMDHETIMKFPAVLTCREFRLRQRHQFLRHLERDQYNPKLPNYVSPLHIISSSDSHFAFHVAKSSLLHFTDFCKTV